MVAIKRYKQTTMFLYINTTGNTVDAAQHTFSTFITLRNDIGVLASFSPYLYATFQQFKFSLSTLSFQSTRTMNM